MIKMLLKFERIVRKVNAERLVSIPCEILDAFAPGQPIDVIYDGIELRIKERAK